MKSKGAVLRTAIGALGGLMLVSVAGLAVAAEVEDDAVEINVEITDEGATGALTLSVADPTTTLAEVESGDPEIRQFDGALPTVTVADTRSEVPSGVFWYVVGQSSDFTAEGVDEAIGAGHLGWAPEVLTEGDGEVAAGDQVDTVLDEGANAVGLENEELFALALDSEQAQAGNGTWKADADLFLKTPANVAPGAYSATLTLTLWEDEF